LPRLAAMSNVKTTIKRAVPASALRAYRAARGHWDRHDLLFAANATPSPLAELYRATRSIPGYFTYDDAVAFTLVLSTQTAAGVKGDVLEIGSYHGLSTVFIARCIQDAERLVVCDSFEAPTEGDDSAAPPSPESVRAVVERFAGTLPGDQLDVRAGRSDTLNLEDLSLRFAHVDGGHSHDVALHDLRLVSRHLAPGGVIVVDDYGHAAWPGVTTAADQFLIENSGFVVMADVNRWSESGRKLYLRCS
jgi:predicted O-methyltransferase YrrM